MTSLNEIRQLFFVECEEQLEQLNDGLKAIEAAGTDNTPDGETINTMFRAAHSIKGGAASFALNAITRFAHAFESVLDEVRSGTLAMTQERLRVFYHAADFLADLVAMGAEGHEPDDAILQGQIAAITSISHAPPAAKPQVAAPQPEPLRLHEEGDYLAAFTPLAISFSLPDEPSPPEQRRYGITFQPRAELYANGHEPLHLLRELADLGDLSISAQVDDTVTWADHSPTVVWTIDLSSSCSETDIREIFEFAEPFAAISVESDSRNTTPALNAWVPGASASNDPDGHSQLPETAVASHDHADSNVVPFSPQGISAADTTTKASAKATVRVDLDLVDTLINTVGELVITQSVMSQLLAETGVASGSRLTTTLEEFRGLTRRIQEGIMAIRAQSVKPLFQRMARIVRETAQIAEKDVRFVTEGEDTEIDRTVVERLVDPLTHILRNAIDHGLEHADRRLGAGKNPAGTVTLSAAHRSGRVLIEVRDDGGGIDREKVLAIAIKKGLVPANAVLSPAEIDRLLFLPGFSTASSVTSLSGRGVGMDVVNNEIKRLGGRVSITSEFGRGTVLSISLPLTLAVLDGMIVKIAGQTMVVPIAAISETIRPEPEQIHDVGRSDKVVTVRDLVIPITDLGILFGYTDQPALDRGGVLILIEDDHGHQRALAVDRIQDQSQVVIKSLEANYGQVPYVAAATILGDGQIALIVDLDQITFHKTARMPVQQLSQGGAT